MTELWLAKIMWIIHSWFLSMMSYGRLKTTKSADSQSNEKSYQSSDCYSISKCCNYNQWTDIFGLPSLLHETMLPIMNMLSSKLNLDRSTQHNS